MTNTGLDSWDDGGFEEDLRSRVDFADERVIGKMVVDLDESMRYAKTREVWKASDLWGKRHYIPGLDLVDSTATEEDLYEGQSGWAFDDFSKFTADVEGALALERASLDNPYLGDNENLFVLLPNYIYTNACVVINVAYDKLVHEREQLREGGYDLSGVNKQISELISLTHWIEALCEQLRTLATEYVVKVRAAGRAYNAYHEGGEAGKDITFDKVKELYEAAGDVHGCIGQNIASGSYFWGLRMLRMHTDKLKQIHEPIKRDVAKANRLLIEEVKAAHNGAEVDAVRNVASEGARGLNI